MIFEKKRNGNIHVTEQNGNTRIFSCRLNVLPHPLKKDLIIISEKSRVEPFSGDFTFSWKDIETPEVTSREDAIEKLAGEFFNIENYYIELITRNSDAPSIVEETSDGYYLGYAAAGTQDTSEASFMIKKVVESGSITTIKFANGSVNYDKAWDDRASYEYKFPA